MVFVCACRLSMSKFNSSALKQALFTLLANVKSIINYTIQDVISKSVVSHIKSFVSKWLIIFYLLSATV